MDGFGLFCTIVSMLLMVVFNIICIKKYGLLSCFSAYGEKWEQYSKEHNLLNTNIWSIITIVSAMLLVPPILVTSAGYTLQFMCFFCPLYLFLVGITPDYAYVKQHNRLHISGVLLCIFSMLIWLIFIVHRWFVLIPIAVLWLLVGLSTRTLKKSFIYYVEMVFYLTAYVVLLTI